jgi:hypothetical protein
LSGLRDGALIPAEAVVSLATEVFFDVPDRASRKSEDRSYEQGVRSSVALPGLVGR